VLLISFSEWVETIGAMGGCSEGIIVGHRLIIRQSCLCFRKSDN
jgi:hypothetical protein